MQPADSFPITFIIGSERSGTTLLATLIDRHPDVAVPPETHFFVNTRKRRLGPYSDAERPELIKLVTEGRRFKDAGISPSALSERFSQYPADLRHLFQSALETYAHDHNKTLSAAKTPSYLFHVNRIQKWYPKARFIYLYRDGRDVVASLLKMPWRKKHGERRLIDYWIRTINLGFHHETRLRDRWLSVQYESLVQHPEATLARVMRFMELPFFASQLVPTSASAVVPDWEKDWKAAATKEIDTSQLQKWRDADPAITYLRTLLMRRQLVRAGYTLELEQLPPPARRLSLRIKAALWKSLRVTSRF